jgi:hypothetical protein
MHWAPIPGFEGRYEASDTGLIRSLDRVIETRRGSRRLGGRVLKPGKLGNTNHRHVVLDGRVDRTVHSLVLEAFVGPCPPGMMARHINDNPTDNRLENLCWGTRSENSYDAVRNGRHWQANKTHCIYGHPLAGGNLLPTKHRLCRECARRRNREYRARKASAGIPSRRP